MNTIICPNCGRSLRAGELTCPHCHHFLGANPEKPTRTLPIPTEQFSAKRVPIGSIPTSLQRITLVIGSETLELPVSQSLIIGRDDPASNAPPPDVELYGFGADEKGVSRHHLEFSWRNELLYVRDVGSTNGTLLNGQRLMKDIVRLLRDGDELVIGHLPVRVQFSKG